MTPSDSATHQDSVRMSDHMGDGQPLHPGPDMVDYLKDYARQKPEVAALWCLGIGFVLGWKLKPW